MEEGVYRQLECLRLPARYPETLGVIAAGHVWNKPSEADSLKEKVERFFAAERDKAVFSTETA